MQLFNVHMMWEYQLCSNSHCTLPATQLLKQNLLTCSAQYLDVYAVAVDYICVQLYKVVLCNAQYLSVYSCHTLYICVQLYMVVQCSAQYLSVHSCHTHSSVFVNFTQTLDVCVYSCRRLHLCAVVHSCAVQCTLYNKQLYCTAVHCDISRDRFLHCCSSNQHPHSL